MIHYVPTHADRAPVPRPRDGSGPEYAEFVRPYVRPVQPHVDEALRGGPAPAGHGYGVEDAARRMSAPGYEPLETGWTRRPRGHLVACRTDMPGVTAAMWDWWFGWHSTESARYRLWHPEAHRSCALGEDRPGARTDRERYVGNVSYVDEYVGESLQHLAIRFVDPGTLGFDDRPGHTTVCARAGLGPYPVALGWLVHQVRPTDRGAEMRSRFFLDDAEILDIPGRPGFGAGVLASRAVRPLVDAVLSRGGGRVLGRTFPRDLLRHCGEEMNHLAGFLPELYERFRGTP